MTKRFEACGWHVSEVADGNDLKAIEEAIKDAQKIKDKPKLIRDQNDHRLWNAETGNVESAFRRSGRRCREGNKTQSRLARKQELFIPKEVSRISVKQLKTVRSSKRIGTRRLKNTQKRFPSLAAAFRDTRSDELPDDWEKSLPKFDGVEAKATRAYSGDVINAIAEAVPQLVGGSGDLTPSNNTFIKSSADIQAGQLRKPQHPFRHPRTRDGFGDERHGFVWQRDPFRRHVSDVFGLYAPGDSACCAFAYSDDLCRFTHDSIGLGEDGPTHQSVEHLAALRAIPNLALIRPCDAHEVREAWRAALNAPMLRRLSPFTSKSCADRQQEICERKRPAQRRIRSSRSRNKSGQRNHAETHSHRDRFRGRPRNGSPRKTKRRRNADPRRLDAVLGILRRSAAKYKESPARKRQCPSRHRSRRFTRLGKIRRDSGDTLPSTASAHPHRPKMCFAIMDLRLRT